MALNPPRPSDMATIIASAQQEGSAFTRMLTGRDERYCVLDHDPGFKRGDWLFEDDTLLGRVTWVGSNEDPDDWITGQATKWTVKFEKPWNQFDVATSIGNAKIEWLEDTLMPRVGRVISVEPGSYFAAGDIVRMTGPSYDYTLIKRTPVGSKIKRLFWRW